MCHREAGNTVYEHIHEEKWDRRQKLKHKEDLKMAAFKKLYPLELQNQLVLINMRLITYETQNSVEIR